MKVGTFERQVLEVEGFNIKVLDYQGRDIRSDAFIPGLNYNFSNAAPKKMTVNQFIQHRFRGFIGIGIQVMDGSGQPVYSHTKLRTLRYSYE